MTSLPYTLNVMRFLRPSRLTMGMGTVHWYSQGQKFLTVSLYSAPSVTRILLNLYLKFYASACIGKSDLRENCQKFMSLTIAPALKAARAHGKFGGIGLPSSGHAARRRTAT